MPKIAFSIFLTCGHKKLLKIAR